MDKIHVTGGRKLNGEVTVSGAKNACLTLMPLSILTDEPLKMRNVPELSDIDTMKQLLISLGSNIQSDSSSAFLQIQTKSISNHVAIYDLSLIHI